MEKIDQILDSLYSRVIEPEDARKELFLLSDVIGSFTMQDIMLYYQDAKGYDFNSKVVDVLNSMVNDR